LRDLIRILAGFFSLACGCIFLASCDGDATGPGSRPAKVVISGLGLANPVLEPGEEPFLTGRISANGHIDTVRFKVLPVGRPADDWDASGIYVGFYAGSVQDTNYDLGEKKVRLLSDFKTRPGAYRIYAYAYSGNASDTDSVDVTVGSRSVYGWVQSEGGFTAGDSVKVTGRIFAKTPLLEAVYEIKRNGVTVTEADGLTVRHNPLTPGLTFFDVAADGGVRLLAADTLDYCVCTLTLTIRTEEETKAISGTITLYPKHTTLLFDVPADILRGDTAVITGHIQSPAGLDNLDFWITRTGADTATHNWFTIVNDRSFADKRTWDFQTDGGMRLVVDSGAAIGSYLLNVSIKSGKYESYIKQKPFKVVTAAP
jgi:hypothetical protein